MNSVCLFVCSLFSIKKYPAVATHLPYGHSTKRQKIQHFFEFQTKKKVGVYFTTPKTTFRVDFTYA